MNRFRYAFLCLVIVLLPALAAAQTMNYSVSSDWECEFGQSCMDVYDVYFTQGTQVNLSVTSVTGNSVVRLAVFGPGDGLDGTNLLTGTNQDLECDGQNAITLVPWIVPETGLYCITVVRDWGSSGGFDGTYTFGVQADDFFTVAGQTADDVASQAAGSICIAVPLPVVAETTGSWNCGLGESCMDVFTFDAGAGTQWRVDVTNVTGNSVPRLALFAPGVPLSGNNLLTGTNQDRECVGQDTDDSASLTLPATGTYRLAVVRDWGSSAGFTGTYSLTLRADATVSGLAQIQNDIPSQAAGSICVATPLPFTTEISADWSCAFGQSCMDTYKFDIPSGAKLEVEVTNVTGNSVPILALFDPTQGLDGINLLTGTNLDRECVGQDTNDLVTGITAGPGGTYQLAVGRDWGSSAGFVGTYTVRLSSDQAITYEGPSQDDVSSQAAGTICGPVGEAYAAEFNGAWACGLGESCMDTYDLNLSAGTDLSIDVSEVTGGSALRLALFAPSGALDGVNLLTGTTEDLECGGQDEPQNVSIDLPLSGVYQLAVVRDWGSSTGFNGTYKLNVQADLPMTATGPTQDDISSLASGSVCVPTPALAMQAPGSWNCAFNESCADVFDLELTAGMELDIQVTDITGDSVPRLAIFAPGEPPSGTNLLTGTNLDRECVGQDKDDVLAPWIVPSTGTYQIWVGRDWSSSAGFSGTYVLHIDSDDSFGATQVSDDVPSQAAGSQCIGTSARQTGDWNCGFGESCMDVYDVDIPAGSRLTVAMSEISGSSVPRLAVFGPGEPLSGLNLITGTNLDRECVGQDADDSVSLLAAEGGTYRIAAVRDWGSSAGQVGTYTLDVTTDQPSSFLGRTENDLDSLAAGSICTTPEPFEFIQNGDWACQLGESCQDVYEVFLSADTDLSITATTVTGNSVPLLALYAPGVPLGGKNLLTQTTEDRECVGQDTTDTTPTLRVAEDGVYLLAVGRDWGSSAGFNGTYQLRVTANRPFGAGPQIVDDVDSVASGTTCAPDPTTAKFEVDGGWNCLVGQTCQDVYDIYIEEGTMLSLAVTNLTGSSVPRLALFAPGVPLSGDNLLTGRPFDRECVGQDEDDILHATIAPTSGIYRLAIGRDWGSSAGLAGTYRLILLANSWMDPQGQTVNDGVSQAMGSVCGSPTAVEDDAPILATQLVGAYPNPFNPQTQIVFELPSLQYARVEIFDLRGRLVRRLAEGQFETGRHEIPWNGRDDRGMSIASGTYFARLVTPGATQTMKLALLK